MSKETKFLSIAIGLLQGLNKDENITDAVVDAMNADRLYKFTQLVNEKFVDPSIKRTNETDYNARNDRNRFHGNGLLPGKEEFGNIFVETRCFGKGTPAQVKLFKLLENETPESFDRVNGKITMIRDMTGFDGCLSRKLAPGRYVIEISKGGEYSIITDDVEIEAGKFSNKSYDLNRFTDLENEGWMPGELHHHSIYSSPVFRGDDDVVETPEQIANSMMAVGLSYGALSDHHNILNHSAWKAMRKDDFVPIISKEISTSNGHVMAMGVAKDVIYAIPDAADRTDEYLRNEFVRITDEIKENGGLAQINHPRDLQKAISWNPDFNDMLDIFETMEIWNGSNPMMSGSTNDAARTLWHECMKKGLFLPATTGSDTHNICADDYHILFDEVMDTIDAIKTNKKALEKEYSDEIHTMLLIGERLLPILEKWAETNLTSGCVRTYVHFDAAEPKDATHTQANILDTLRRGNSFLTNGPILIPKVSGKLPGERVRISDDEAELSIEIKLLANRPLHTLQICTENGVRREIPIKGHKENGFYDYSMSLSEAALDDNYMYFLAKDDCTNLAISNPVIFVRKNE